MLDEMPVMASRGLIMVLFKLFILHHWFPILLLILRYHSIMGSDLGSGREKVAQMPDSQAQHWRNKFVDTLFPLLWERLESPKCTLVHIKGVSRGLMH